MLMNIIAKIEALTIARFPDKANWEGNIIEWHLVVYSQAQPGVV